MLFQVWAMSESKPPAEPGAFGKPGQRPPPGKTGERALRGESDESRMWAEFARRPLRGELREREPMSRHTSWRTGGVADRAYLPADLADLAVFLRGLPETEAVHFVGLGSNLLVRDGGLRGTVILLHGGLKQMHLVASEDDAVGVSIYAEAGIASPKLSRFAAIHDFEGAEFLAGIPGTIGGALAMNAGCYGSETWRHVDRVLTIDRRGELLQRGASDYRVVYRQVELREDIGVANAAEEWFVAAWFRFARGDGEIARGKVKELLTTRIRTQPLAEPNAGSVFRNPPTRYAAELIENCGLKGARIGGAMVSPKHANFIVNTGKASADDIERLIEKLRDSVLRAHRVLLEPEVHIVGEEKHAI